ncbi:MAG TPA: hypothetical protein VE152_04345 [Acidimicrobiales bacterium]|nr:hypothetical protein [Acidimicrobiales bacterium]
MTNPNRSRTGTLRAASLAGLMMLVVEDGLGMWVNLYARVPPADHGAGLGSGVAKAVVNGGLVTVIANGPVGLSVHVVVGLILLLTAIFVVVRAAFARRALLVSTAAVGLAAMLVAAGGGARFVGQGNPNASLVMALGTGLAILCYAVILFASPATEGSRAKRWGGEARAVATSGLPRGSRESQETRRHA